MRIKRVVLALGLMSVAIPQNIASAADRSQPQGTELGLTKPFHTRSDWRLVVTEGSPAKDYGDNDAPGALTICLHKEPAAHCISEPVSPAPWPGTPDDQSAWAPHYLFIAKAVYPRGPQGAPLLEIVTGSLNSGDGDQVVSTVLAAYDPERDTFRRVFAKATARNNNQEIRFVTDGPLRGSVISAEPQQHRPYGYWIEVNQLNAAGTYGKALRYRSATLYGDGNRLAVIDSEMPNILKRLGLWKLGDPLPTPPSCGKPVLRHAELWCE